MLVTPGVSVAGGGAVGTTLVEDTRLDEELETAELFGKTATEFA